MPASFRTILPCCCQFNLLSIVLISLLSILNIYTTASLSSPYLACVNSSSCTNCLSMEMCIWNKIQSICETITNDTMNEEDYCTHDSPRIACCTCVEQQSCVECGSLGLNYSCTWDLTYEQCNQNHTCPDDNECLHNPTLLECEYPSGICQFFFSTTLFWTLGYAGMILFFICLPCCLYHKCGIDWDSEFAVPLTTINDHQRRKRKYNVIGSGAGDSVSPSPELHVQMVVNDNHHHVISSQQSEISDGYVFKGGAHITGKCMYVAFFVIGSFFAALAIIGTFLSIGCIAQRS